MTIIEQSIIIELECCVKLKTPVCVEWEHGDSRENAINSIIDKIKDDLESWDQFPGMIEVNCVEGPSEMKLLVTDSDYYALTGVAEEEEHDGLEKETDKIQK